MRLRTNIVQLSRDRVRDAVTKALKEYGRQDYVQFRDVLTVVPPSISSGVVRDDVHSARWDTVPTESHK